MSQTTEYTFRILERIFEEPNYDRKKDLGQRFILPGVYFNEKENNSSYETATDGNYQTKQVKNICTMDETSVHQIETRKLLVDKIYNGRYSGGKPTITKKKKSLAVVPTWITVPQNSKFFVIKSANLDHVKRSFYNGIWSSTHFGNKKLSQAFKDLRSQGRLFLFFSVNSSGRFCGVAEMVSDIESQLDTSLWDDSHKFGAAFRVRWVIVKDLNNKFLKKFIIVKNDMKPITNSRDTQEVPFEIGQAILKLFITENSSEMQCFLDPEYQ